MALSAKNAGLLDDANEKTSMLIQSIVYDEYKTHRVSPWKTLAEVTAILESGIGVIADLVEDSIRRTWPGIPSPPEKTIKDAESRLAVQLIALQQAWEKGEWAQFSKELDVAVEQVDRILQSK